MTSRSQQDFSHSKRKLVTQLLCSFEIRQREVEYIGQRTLCPGLRDGGLSFGSENLGNASLECWVGRNYTGDTGYYESGKETTCATEGLRLDYQVH